MAFVISDIFIATFFVALFNSTASFEQPVYNNWNPFFLYPYESTTAVRNPNNVENTKHLTIPPAVSTPEIARFPGYSVYDDSSIPVNLVPSMSRYPGYNAQEISNVMADSTHGSAKTDEYSSHFDQFQHSTSYDQPQTNMLGMTDALSYGSNIIQNITNNFNSNIDGLERGKSKSDVILDTSQNQTKLEETNLPQFVLNLGAPGSFYSGGVLGYFMRISEEGVKKEHEFNPNERLDMLISALGKYSTDKAKLVPLRELLSDPRLETYLGPSFDPSKYPTNGKLLRGILLTSLKSPAINSDSRWFNTVSYYVDKVQTTGVGNQRVEPAFFYQLLDESTMETIAEDNEIFYPQVELLLSALGPYANDKEQIKVLVDFLRNPNLGDNLGPAFQPSLYKTNGELLQNILTEALYSKEVRADEDLQAAVKFYINKIANSKESEVPISPDFFNRLALAESRQIVEDFIAPVDILLTALGPYKQDQDKIKILRKFLTNPALGTVLRKEFVATAYSTNGELLQGILLEALYSGMVKEDEELYDTIQYFMNKARAGGDSSSIAVGRDFFSRLPQSLGTRVDSDPNVEYLLSALSPNVMDLQEMTSLRKFLNNSKKLLSILGPEFDFTAYFTIGQLLQGILMKALSSAEVKKDPVLSDVIRFFVAKVRNTGSAAKSVDTGPYDIREGILDLNGAFGALDMEKIASGNQALHLKNLYNFFMTEFNPKMNLKYFPFHDYKTKGQFLLGLFRHLIASKKVSISTKQDLQVIKWYIRMTGPGSVPFELLTVN